MISIKTIRKLRCPFAICVILSIALVLGCDFLCDLGIVSFQLPQPPLVSESSSHNHEREDEHPSSGHQDNHKSHDHGSAEHHHESPNEEGCCDDFTRQFYSSLVSTSGTQVSVVHSAFYRLISTLTFVERIENNSITGTLPSNSKFEHRPNGPPGYSGHNIRVLFCSYLI
jgi:hypothetical protein